MIAQPWPTRKSYRGNRVHVFEQPGGKLAECGGPRFCRECNKEAKVKAAAKAAA